MADIATKTIRCRNQRNGKPCGNIIAASVGGEFIIRRHGREIHIPSSSDMKIRIVCERCGKETVLKGDFLKNE